MRRASCSFAMVVGVLWGTRAEGQRLSPAMGPPLARASLPADSATTRGVLPIARGPFDVDPARRRAAPWWAPVASLAVPGAGQLALRQQRAFGYLAAEAFFVSQWAAARRDAVDGRDAYRRIAREVARAAFGGPLRDGPWVYYESMERYLESGAYNRGTGGSFVPEPDEATYNGRQWRLARETYWVDPAVAPATSSAEYQRALTFYQRRAVPDAFRWSWSNAQLQQDEYRQRIRRSNASFRQAADWASFLVANHLLGAIDGFVSVRLRRTAPTGALPGGDGAARGDAWSWGGGAGWPRAGRAIELTLPVPGRRRAR